MTENTAKQYKLLSYYSWLHRICIWFDNKLIQP